MALVPIFNLQALLQVAEYSLAQNIFANSVQPGFGIQCVNQSLQSFTKCIRPEITQAGGCYCLADE